MGEQSPRYQKPCINIPLAKCPKRSTQLETPEACIDDQMRIVSTDLWGLVLFYLEREKKKTFIKYEMR